MKLDKKYIKDTTFINKKGEFIFSGEEELPGGIYIVYFPNKSNFEIIGTGHSFEFDYLTHTYIDSLFDGPFVWHIWSINN